MWNKYVCFCKYMLIQTLWLWQLHIFPHIMAVEKWKHIIMYHWNSVRGFKRSLDNIIIIYKLHTSVQLDRVQLLERLMLETFIFSRHICVLAHYSRCTKKNHRLAQERRHKYLHSWKILQLWKWNMWVDSTRYYSTYTYMYYFYYYTLFHRTNTLKTHLDYG